MPEKITSTFNPVAISGDNKTWVVTAGSLVSAYDQPNINESGTGNTLKVHGMIVPQGDDNRAIYSTGSDFTFQIEKNGYVTGSLHFLGANARLINQGELISSTVAVNNDIDNFHVDNGGIIRSINFGPLQLGGDGVVITNYKAGQIVASAGAAINNGGDAGETSIIRNHGLISTRYNYAIDAGDSDDRIINDGTIIGDISLSSGNDLFDNRHGVLKGYVSGGEGNDTYIVDKANIVIHEFADDVGTDTVKSLVSFKLAADYAIERLFLIGNKNINGTGNEFGNVLKGNAGSNTLDGKGGADRLDGGKGNDVLHGGDGADIFVFSSGYGRDRIEDFKAVDSIDLDGWKAIEKFADVKAHASNHGDDVWITAGKDVLVIEGTHKADLTAGDFQF